jgi:broad specificity phosphatase PhoE
MKFYFVRHGESTFNAKELHQDENAPLSKKGIKQAEELAKRFKKIPVDLVISSPFTRTKQTTEIINKIINKNTKFNSLIVELKRPSVFLGKHYLADDVVEIKKVISKNLDNPNWRHSDEETFFEFKDRALKFLKEMENQKINRALVVTHGDFMRAVLGIVLFGDSFDSERYIFMREKVSINNTSISEFEFKNNKWKLITWNDLSHLA